MFQTPKKAAKQQITSPSVYSDRFIPARSEIGHFLSSDKENTMESSNVGKGRMEDELLDPHSIRSSNYKKLLFSSLEGEGKILSFSSPNQSEKRKNKAINLDSSSKRTISKKPFKVLEAPGVSVHPCSSVLDWCSKTQKVGIALSNCVYGYSLIDGNVSKICEMKEKAIPDFLTFDLSNSSTTSDITSLKFNNEGNQMSIQNEAGNWVIIDSETGKETWNRREDGESFAVEFIDKDVIAKGDVEGDIRLFDLRRSSQNPIRTLVGHSNQILTLSLNPSTGILLSTGWDQKAFTWNLKTDLPESKMNSIGLAKACCWVTNRNIGIGSLNNKTLRIMNTVNGEELISKPLSKSPYSMVSQDGELLVGTQDSVSNLTLFNGTNLKKLVELEGHPAHLIHMAKLGNGKVATAAGDESVRLWDIWPEFKKRDLKSELGEINFKDFR